MGGGKGFFFDLWRDAVASPAREGGEIVVDLFCGGGGASTGIEAALGRAVDVAVNHNPKAVLCHERNHPGTRHLRADVFDVRPVEVTRGRPVGLLWLSPDCTHFSKSRGSAPKSKKIRSLATVGLWYAREVRPRVIMLENVEEFVTWGRLDKRTGQPDRRYRGEMFYKFVRRLQAMGYVVEARVLKACDFGAPTSRKRLFLVARRDGVAIQWPTPTHGPGRRKPWRTAAECIDFSRPGVSIFATREEVKAAGLKAVRPLAERTMERIARGMWKFVIENPAPFVVAIDNGGQVAGEWAGDVPLGTITRENRFAVVMPWLAKHYGGVVGSGVGSPLGTVTGIDHHSLVACHVERMHGKSTGESLAAPVSALTAQVNKHALVACHIERMHGTATGEAVDAPMSALTAQGGHHALTTCHLMKYHGTKGNECRAHEVDKPLPTVDGSNRFALVRAFLVKYYGNGIGQPVDVPLGTVTGNDRFGLVTVHGDCYRIVDITLRMLEPEELLRAQFGEHARGYRLEELTKAEAVSMVGNSVCPDVVKALVKANCRRRPANVREPMARLWHDELPGYDGVGAATLHVLPTKSVAAAFVAKRIDATLEAMA